MAGDFIGLTGWLSAWHSSSLWVTPHSSWICYTKWKQHNIIHLETLRCLHCRQGSIRALLFYIFTQQYMYACFSYGIFHVYTQVYLFNRLIVNIAGCSNFLRYPWQWSQNYYFSDVQKAYQKVFDWQFICCLELWTSVICAYNSEADFRPLAYPLTQIISGVACLVPTARYFPVRIRCIKMLNRLAAATGTFIPVSSLLLDMLEMKELNSPTTGGIGKAVNFLGVKQVDFVLVIIFAGWCCYY